MSTAEGWRSVQEHNRARVLRAVQAMGTVTLADVQAATGLPRRAATECVAALERGRQITRLEARRRTPGPGRPATLWRPTLPEGVAVVVDIGWSRARVALGDPSGGVLLLRSTALDPDRGMAEHLDAIRLLVDDALVEASSRPDALRAVVLSVPSPVGLDGTVLARRLRDVDLVSGLGLDRFDAPVLTYNDGDLGAAAGATFGPTAGTKDLVYVHLSHGVGAGLVIDGRLYRGTGVAANLGHVRVVKSGRRCRVCGSTGCLETVAAVTAVTGADPRTKGADGLVRLRALLDGGDARALGTVRACGAAVGRALTEVVALVNPAEVRVGGELATLGEPLLEEIRRPLAHLRSSAARPLRVAVTGDADHPQVLGGLAVAFGLIGDLRTEAQAQVPAGSS